MRNQRKLRKISGFLGIILLLTSMIVAPMNVSAQNKTEQLTGKFYEFGEKSKYEISSSTTTASVTPLGTLNVSGDYKTTGSGESTQYDVSKDNLTLTYTFDSSILSNPNDKWHLYEDGTKSVDGIKLEDKIKNGVIIIQTSLDRSKWVTDTVKLNAFTAEYNNSEAIYTTKDIQLVNGCYYRVIIAYEQEIVSGTSQVFFVTRDKKEYKKNAEVYEFYAVNSSEKALSDVSSTPRKELGDKICVKKDTGFSQQISMDNKNPHYGWSIGTFSVNGYTRETSENGNPMFLKDAGDKVILWFKLAKDIDNLDGNGKYSIIEDKNGYDQYFEVPKTNFKHGALIIRFTDHEGVKHNPIIYTDFLAANATTGADTKAVLFEEGDYEVALDYTIGEKGVFGSENDYRIFFKFSIRNGNTMFFPFDLSTGAELRDKAITPKGFTIDMAKSRYLNINVKRTAIVKGATDCYEDVRFNGPAKDGAQYTDEGVYTVEVTNQYTDEHTVKTFYVGSDPFMIAMAKSGKTVKELNEFISQGYTIEADGSLVAPPEPEPEIEEEPEQEEIAEEKATEEVKEEVAATPTEQDTKTEVGEEKVTTEDSADVKEEAEIEEPEEETKKSSGAMGIIVVLSIIVAGVAVAFAMHKKKKAGNISVKTDTDNEEKRGES